MQRRIRAKSIICLYFQSVCSRFHIFHYHVKGCIGVIVRRHLLPVHPDSCGMTDSFELKSDISACFKLSGIGALPTVIYRLRIGFPTAGNRNRYTLSVSLLRNRMKFPKAGGQLFCPTDFMRLKCSDQCLYLAILFILQR